ncbi:MAG: hypothetical protein WB558_02545 [Terriglobales bacterium]
MILEISQTWQKDEMALLLVALPNQLAHVSARDAVAVRFGCAGVPLNWYGLNWTDIIINVTVLAIVPGLVGALGGHLAAEGLQEEKRRFWIKLIFWAMCAVWILATFWQQFRVAEADLDRTTKDEWANALLSAKFPPPPAPVMMAPTHVEPKAKMEFVFYSKGSLEGAPVKEISLPVLSGAFSLGFSARVVGRVIPKDGAVWIKICDQCSFTGDMPGFLSDKDDPPLAKLSIQASLSRNGTTTNDRK